MPFVTDLPIKSVLGKIVSALKHASSVVISAEPGAGKSTCVPLALLDAGFAANGKIMMLEPRRLAARACARRMSELIGEQAGRTVGFRTALDTCVSHETKIEVVTEGVLINMMRRDSELPDVSCVIFDEFHERSLNADLALALALDVRENLRTDLKIAVMSATMDTDAVAALLGGAEVIYCAGRCFDVKTIYSAEHARLDLPERVANAVSSALKAFPGDALVFLPGEYEIRSATAALSRRTFDFAVETLPLYGSLSGSEQDRVFSHHEPDIRRVILSTSVAETSITVPSVKIVVDSGLSRHAFFSLSSGMDSLETKRVSLASADQRRGRAGRVSEGVCIRLWDEFENGSLDRFTPPEILVCDLAGFALDLSKWGVRSSNIGSMRFLDPPPESAYARACALLRSLGAVDSRDVITKHGETLLALPLHPRLAHAVSMCSCESELEAAAALCAILSERDFIINPSSADIHLRLEALKNGARNMIVNRMAFERVKRIYEKIYSSAVRLPRRSRAAVPDPAAFAAAAAYPDRIAFRRDLNTSEYTLANGVPVRLQKNDVLVHNEYLAVAETSANEHGTVIRLASALDIDMLRNSMPEIFERRIEVTFDPEKRACVREETERIGSIVISRKNISKAGDAEAVTRVLLDGVRTLGLSSLGFSKSALAFRERVNFLRFHGLGDYPDLSDAALLNTLEDWLAPYAGTFSKIAELERLDYRSIFENMIPRTAPRIETLAPERLEMPTGSMIRVDYSDPSQPTVSVRLQELFGLMNTPRVCGGRIPVLMDILSPAMRTVQKTSDLESFWKTSYFLVRKDMRGRYPKHDWPENPLDALPHRGVRARPVK